MSYVQITCESTGDKKERPRTASPAEGRASSWRQNKTSQTVTANSQYYGTERRESASPGGMSFGEMELEYVLNFLKILVSWRKFKKALWSKTGWRDRDGRTLWASQKAQKAHMGIHTAGQKEATVWTDWGLGMAVKCEWENWASAPEPGDPVQAF